MQLKLLTFVEVKEGGDAAPTIRDAFSKNKQFQDIVFEEYPTTKSSITNIMFCCHLFQENER